MHPLIKRIRFEYEIDLEGSKAFHDQLLSGRQPNPLIVRQHFTLILEINRSCKPDLDGTVGLDGSLTLELTKWGQTYIADNKMGEFVRYIRLVEAEQP